MKQVIQVLQITLVKNLIKFMKQVI